MRGQQWYEIQAFRAYNQALGRCIRHVKDWGAIILLDCRLSDNENYRNYLSKWIKERIQVFENFNDFDSNLTEFLVEFIEKPNCSDSNENLQGNAAETKRIKLNLEGQVEAGSMGSSLSL